MAFDSVFPTIFPFFVDVISWVLSLMFGEKGNSSRIFFYFRLDLKLCFPSLPVVRVLVHSYQANAKSIHATHNRLSSLGLPTFSVSLCALLFIGPTAILCSRYTVAALHTLAGNTFHVRTYAIVIVFKEAPFSYEKYFIEQKSAGLFSRLEAT